MENKNFIHLMKYGTEKQVFNDEYEILRLMESNLSYKIYACASLKKSKKHVLIKINRKSVTNPEFIS